MVKFAAKSESEYKNSLSILQINLNHSYTATEHLKINQLTLKNQITCIQEPYYVKNKIIGFSTRDTIIQGNIKPRTAIIIHNNKLIDLHIEKTERNIIAIVITTKTEELLLINVYAPPNDDIKETIKEVKEITDKFEHLPTLIVGDFNAKNPVWGGAQN